MRHYRHSRLLTEWLLCAGLLLGIGVYLGYSKYLDHQHIDASERSRLSSQALVIEKNLVPQLVSAGRVLDGLVMELSSDPAKAPALSPLNERLVLISETLTGISAILVTDPNGKIIHTNVKHLLGFDTTGRGYFQDALQQRQKGRAYVPAPFVSALATTPIALVKEITGARGEFGGVVLAALDPALFGTLLESVRFTLDTRVSLVHSDGKAYKTVPAVVELADKDLTQPGCLFSQHKSSGQAGNVLIGKSCLSGEVEMTAFRTVQPPLLGMDKAFVVTVSRDVSAIYAQWHRELTEIAWMFGGLALMACSGLFFYQKRRRLFQQLAQLNDSARRASDARLRSFLRPPPMRF
jgi:hypothetical protein